MLFDNSANLTRREFNQTTTNLKIGPTYKNDQLRQLRLTDLPTRQPFASCLNFFSPRTKYFEILWLPQSAHLQAAYADPQPKLAKEPLFANTLFNLVTKICQHKMI